MYVLFLCSYFDSRIYGRLLYTVSVKDSKGFSYDSRIKAGCVEFIYSVKEMASVSNVTVVTSDTI